MPSNPARFALKAPFPKLLTMLWISSFVSSRHACSSPLLQHPDLSFQNTDRSLSRAIEDRQRSAPSAQHIQRSFCLHPSLVSCVSLATQDDLKIPPNALCVFELCAGAHSMGLLPSAPSHSHPSPSCQTLQVQYLPGQRLCGASILP